MIERFLAPLAPMRAAKARAALEAMVRHNGAAELVSRATLIERKVREGATVSSHKALGRVLITPAGHMLDTRNITSTGLDYAAFLVAESLEGSGQFGVGA